MNTVEIIEADQPAALVPMDLMQRAVTSGADITILEKLMGLQERWEANQARKAFEAAIAGAKATIPVIEKKNLVDYPGKSGRIRYKYADFATIAEAITPMLSENGLSYRFRTNQTDTKVTVTCIVAHSAGHSEETTLSAPPDDSGNKNARQAVGSAVTFLQRYTLMAALGLAAAEDDDGRGGTGTTETQSEYLSRWAMVIRDATDDVELKTQWQEETDLRRQIFSARDNDVVKRLVDKVIARCKELKTAQEQHEADLQTQRLEAQDS